MQSNKPQLIVISGPTASGKTGAAMRIFDDMPHEGASVELINMDSTQAYIDMNIGTAKPTTEELARYPHHLLDIRLPTDSYSASDFYADMLNLVPTIIARGNIPLLVGGTMMYLHILQNGMADLPEANADIRAELTQTIEREGLGALHSELKRVDPEIYSQIQGNDTQRLIRFIEVYRLTGRKPSALFAAQTHDSPFDIKHIAIMPKDRAALHARINQRFELMVEQGLLNELRELQQKYTLTPDLPAMRSVGYRQAWAYLAGEDDVDTFIEKGKAATRQLAKRQLTWLRKLPKDYVVNSPDEISLVKLQEMLS